MGFLNHGRADFKFIGPGVPKYRGARIPLISDLNHQAWAKHVKDYPDKIIIQYIRFGLPLSLRHPDQLNNIEIHNHPSAAQFPQAVQDYIDKEIALGVMLGPVPMVHSRHYHRSPIQTRPKDNYKRRVIVNLSYPAGASINDQVTRNIFDNRPFTLRFPKIEDIL